MVGEQVYTLVHSEDHGCVCAGCNAHGHEATGKTDSDAERLNATVDAEDLTPDAIRANDVHRLDDAASSELDEPQEQTARSIFTPGYDTNTNDADQPVDGLISGRAWDRTNLTFSFPDQTSDYGNNYVDSNAASSVQEFSNKQKNAARAALDDFASVSGLNFTELTGNQEGNADLRAAMSDAPGTAYAYYPSSNAVGGDSFYNKGSFNNPVVGNYAYFTILHEYGHALGLKHGHETNGTGAIPFEWDSSEFSVMTYRSYVGKSTSYGLANETWGFAQSLMMLDIAAIQRMYGADFTEEAGDTVYSFSTTTGAMFIDGVEVSTPGANRIFRTIWDGNGEDTYDFSNYSTDLGIDLAPGGYVDLDVGGLFQRAALENGYRGNFEYARGHVFNAMQYEGDARSLIENANGGSGDDTFWGNAADNVFRGNGGDDTFYDSAGADTYYGGGGTDVVRFVGDVASYTIDFVGGFLEVVNDAVDRVAESIETLVFGGESFSFADFTSVILPPPPPPNATPDARNDSLRGDEGTNIANVDLLSNDADPEQSALTIVAIDGRDISGGQSVTLDSGASVRLNGDGTVTYRQNGIFDALLDGQTGNDSFTYTIADPEGARDTATVSVRIDGEGQVANDPEPDEPQEEPDPQPGGFSLYLNAGGQGFTDDSGTAWVSDGSYATQSRATGEGTSIAGGSSADRVYESHRWDPDLAYNIALENGTYDLTFKFAETYFRSAGKRVFDVDVEGVSVIDNLDVYGETGSRGASYDVVVRGVEVRDGRLDIDFSSDKNNAYLAGLVITSDGATPPDPQPEGFSLYLNAGGQGFTDAGGATWVGDGAYAANGRATGESTSISGGSSADSVYNSHRWASDLAYDIDLENGTYDLTFKFAETYFRSAGKRVFDVDVEGVSVIDNLDVYAETGSRGAAYDVVVRGVEVRDGQLDIDFSSDVNNAYLAGLVITSEGGGSPPDPQPSGFSLHMNAGGDGFTDGGSAVWVSDGTYAVNGRATAESTSISNGSSADTVYASHRWASDLAYDIDLENGTYDLTFKFAETYFRSDGKRVFDVDVEGASVIDNLDVYAESGSRGAAYDVAVRGVEVRDGRLDIDFSSDVNNAFLAGLVVTSAAGAGLADDDVPDLITSWSAYADGDGL